MIASAGTSFLARRHPWKTNFVTVLQIQGPFLFGADEKLAACTERTCDLGSVVILRLRSMTAIDATGLLAIERLADRLHACGRTLILCGAHPQPARLMRNARFERHIGPDNICPHVMAAIERATALHANRVQVRAG